MAGAMRRAETWMTWHGNASVFGRPGRFLDFLADVTFRPATGIHVMASLAENSLIALRKEISCPDVRPSCCPS